MSDWKSSKEKNPAERRLCKKKIKCFNKYKISFFKD